MSIINHLTPAYYRVQRMGLQQQGGDVVAIYDVQVLNAAGMVLDTVHPTSALTSQEKTAITAIFTRDKTAFETATSLTEWEDP